MSRGLKRINWGQAFAEVILLLLGVGIALVVDHWRDGIRDRAAEQEHLAALRADFEAADSTLRVRLGMVEEMLDHNERMLTLLGQPVGSVPGDSIAGMLRKSFLDIPVGVEIPSYQDLLSSGDLGLIRSEPLRRALAEYESVNRLADTYAQKAAEQWAGPVTELFVRRLNVTAIYGRESAVDWENPDLPDIPAYEKTPLVDRVPIEDEAFWDLELVNRIAVKNVTLDDAAVFSRASLDLIRQVLPLIDASRVVADDPAETARSARSGQP